MCFRILQEADDKEDDCVACVCGARKVIRERYIQPPRTGQKRAATARKGTTFSLATTFYRGHREKWETNDGTRAHTQCVTTLHLLCSARRGTPPHGHVIRASGSLAEATVASRSAAWIRRGHPGSTVAILRTARGAYTVTLLSS